MDDLRKFEKPSLGTIISTETAPHFIWGNVCDGWWLKNDGRFTVILEVMPKSTSEIKHFHHESEQFFYILEGTLNVELHDKNYVLHKNDSIVISPDLPHRVFNNSAQSVTFLVVSCPGSHEDRVNIGE